LCAVVDTHSLATDSHHPYAREIVSWTCARLSKNVTKSINAGRQRVTGNLLSLFSLCLLSRIHELLFCSISFSKDCKTIDKKQKLIIDWAQYPTPAGYNMRSYFRCPNRPRCNWNPYNRGRDIATRGCGSKNKKRLVVIHDTCRIHSKRASSCTWPAPDSDGTIDMAKPHQDFESVSKFGALR